MRLKLAPAGWMLLSFIVGVYGVPSVGASLLPQPVASPSVMPSADPSASPSAEPSMDPSPEPSADPSPEPSVAPSASPSVLPVVSPRRLDCVSEGVPPADHFTLDQMDTNEPLTDLDAETDGPIERDSFTTRFCANNGCDDNYCFVFFTDDLKLAAQGETQVVRGMMNYFNADLQTADPQTVAITCRVAR